MIHNSIRDTLTLCTLCFNLEGSPDQSKQGGIEGDGAITVERHVHADQALQTQGSGTREEKEISNTIQLLKVFFFN